MKIEPVVVEACAAHCALLAEAMDEEGRELIRSGWGVEPQEGLLQAFRCSALCWTILVDGTPAGMFGCAGDEEGTGHAWLTTAPAIAKVRLRFIRQSRAYIEKMMERHGALMSYAHEKNKPLLAWLQWVGFRVLHKEGEFLRCVYRP